MKTLIKILNKLKPFSWHKEILGVYFALSLQIRHEPGYFKPIKQLQVIFFGRFKKWEWLSNNYK